MLLGSIILYKNVRSWTAWIQQKVLDTRLSHASIYIGPLQQLDRENEFEANLQVDQTTFIYDPKHKDIYELWYVPEWVSKDIINSIMNEYEETTYGFISWPAILIRRIFEALGFKNAKGWNILWGWGVICTELVWHYLYRVSQEMMRYDEKRWAKVGHELYTFNPNLFTPKDLEELMIKHNDCFFKYERK